MGTLSIWHWLIVLAVALLLFGGKGKVSQIMGDFGKGLKAFKKSMRDDEPSADQGPTADPEPKALSSESVRVADAARERDRAARP